MSATRQNFLPADALAEFVDEADSEFRQLVEDVGGVQAAAAYLGVTRQSVHAWLSGSVPTLTLLGAIRVLGYAVVRLNPEWPDDLGEDDKAISEVAA